MFCMKCGSRNPDSSAFCHRCGAAMVAASGETPPALPVQEPFSEVPERVSTQSVYLPDETNTFKNVKEKTPRKTRPAPPPATIGTKMLPVFLCVCFSLSFLLAGSIGLIREILQEDVLEHILEEVDFDDVEVIIQGKTYGLPEYIHENLTEETQNIFSKKAIRRALEDEDVREFMVETLLGYAEYFTDGQRMKTIEAEDIADFIDKKIDDLSDGKIQHLSAREYDNLVANLERSFDFDQITLSGIRKNTGCNPALLQFAFSPLCYWLLFAICVILLVLILLISRDNLCSCIPKLCVTFVVLGAVYLLMALGCVYLMFFAPLEFMSLLSSLFGQVAAFYAARGGIGCIIGLAGLVIGKILRKKESAAI